MFLEHLGLRGFSPATVRAYAFDLANFAKFLDLRSLDVSEIVPTDRFRLSGLAVPTPGQSGEGGGDASSRTGPATMNRRFAAVRGLFEDLVISGVRTDNPVPSPRRASGLRGQRRACWVPSRSGRTAGCPHLIWPHLGG